MHIYLQLLYLLGLIPWSLCSVFFLSLVTVFILKSILFDISIVIQVFFWFPFAGYTFFHPLTFSLCVSLDLKWVSCWQHIYVFCFCIHSAILCLFFFNMYLFLLFIWLLWVLVATRRIFIAACRIFSCGVWALSCGMWDLVHWPGIEPTPPALGAWSLNHWTTREVPDTLCLLIRAYSPFTFFFF